MKQLRAEGIQKLAEALREDCKHLERLSRDDKEIETNAQVAANYLDAIARQVAMVHTGGFWWNNEGCWGVKDGLTVGPFETEQEAEEAVA